MAQSSFFKSCGFVTAAAGIVALSSSGGGAAATALKIGNLLSDAFTYLINDIGTSITIPELNATLHYKDYNIPFSLSGINFDLPLNVLGMIRDSPDLSSYLYYFLLVLGLILSGLLALEVIMGVTLIYFYRDLNEQKSKLNELIHRHHRTIHSSIQDTTSTDTIIDIDPDEDERLIPK